MTLLILLLLPMLFVLLICMRPAQEARSIAFAGTMLTLLWGFRILMGFDFAHTEIFQFEANWNWIPALGLNFSLGIDSVSLMLIALTVFLLPLTVLGSFSAIQHRRKEFYVWLLVLQSAMLGVFMARDLILFYTCFEFTLIPMYFLIAVYGSTNRAKASIVFFLYTFTGSIITLAGLIYLAWFHASLHSGLWTFDIAALTTTATQMSGEQQAWMLLALCCGLAVKVPLFPVHTWLPLAHTEAPTAGSVLLAAVLLKLGTYGLYRFVLPMCPQALVEYAPLIAVLSIIGILYTALICWVQDDIKKLIAYSSVSHLGFCVLGLVALNEIGISGSIAYMINHGLSTGALFLCIGMIYERYHTRAIDDYSGLARRMPIWATFMLFFIMASVGLPGLNGFVGEFLSLIGAFVSGQTVNGHHYGGTLGPWYAAIAGFGMILAAIYLLYLAGRIVWGPVKLPVMHLDEMRANTHGSSSHGPKLPRDLNSREILVLTPIAIMCIVLGLKPGLLLDPIDAPVRKITQTIQMNQHGAPQHALLQTTTNKFNADDDDNTIEENDHQ